MLKIAATKQFRKDYKKCKKLGLDSELREVIDKLSTGQGLDRSFCDHPLKGNYAGFRECHIRSDWVLIYRIEDDKLVLTVVRTGTHSEVLNM